MCKAVGCMFLRSGTRVHQADNHCLAKQFRSNPWHWHAKLEILVRKSMTVPLDLIDAHAFRLIAM
jgi:hypothetical protein